MKELDEVRERMLLVFDNINEHEGFCGCYEGDMANVYENSRDKAIDEILNLEGDGWKIAIVKGDKLPEGFRIFDLSKVIWEADND